MSRLGVFETPAARRVWSATQEVEKQLNDGDSFLSQRSEVILFKNTSGHTIPPFGLMQIDTTELIANRLVHKVIRPYTATSQATVFLVNGRDPVGDNEYSVAQKGPVFRVRTPAIGVGLDGGDASSGLPIIDGGDASSTDSPLDGGDVSGSPELGIGDRLGWTDDSFDAGLGCLMVYLGPDGFASGVGRCIACSATLEGTAETTITSTTEGDVTVVGQSGAHKAKTVGSDIDAGAEVILFPGMHGKWRALEVC